MTKCTSCGVEHGMVIENMETGETTPIDWCKECFFTKGYTYKHPDPIEMDTFTDWGIELRKLEDRIIRDMLISTSVPSQIPDKGDMSP